MATVAKSNALIHARLAGGSNGHRSPRDMFGRNKQRKKKAQIFGCPDLSGNGCILGTVVYRTIRTSPTLEVKCTWNLSYRPHKLNYWLDKINTALIRLIVTLREQWIASW